MNIHQIKQLLRNNLWWGENGNRYEEVNFMPVIMPNKSGVWGIDISHWNIPPVDLKRMKEQFGMSFVVIKANDGALSSRYAAEHVQTAKDAGLPFGLYVWLYPDNRVSIDAQVTAWAKSYNDYKPPLGIFIDAEWTTYAGQPANPSAVDLRLAHDKLKSRIGVTSTTYTAAGYADVYLKGFDWSREPLWVAHYGVDVPQLPKGATKYQFWQFTSQLDGATLDPSGNKSLDGNYYNGTAEQFAAQYGGTIPPNGGTMEKWITNVDLNMRSASSVTGALIQTMPKGSYIWGTVDAATGWISIKYLQKPGEQYATLLTQAAYCSGSATYVTKQVYGDPPLSAITEDVTVIIQRPGWKDLTLTGKQEKI